MSIKFDAILDELRESDAGAVTLTEYDNTDKPSPVSGDIWVKNSYNTDSVAGTPRGLLLTLTYAGNGASTYQLSYKNSAGNIVRTTLS